nr:transposase [Xanthomonas oryzae]
MDEKSQVQALERTQPVLPMGLGYVEGIAHDYVRHGTTTLFAALDIANGSVITQRKPQHRHQEFLSFLRHVDAQVPQDLDVHLICDNDATHKGMAGQTAVLPHALHADLPFLAQSGRTLVWPDHPTGELISPDPQLDVCCSPANSFVVPMFSMTSDSWRC